MKDRVPLYPGRVKLTPVAGQTNVYDLIRADQPQQEGTPLNKASLLTDATAEELGLSDDPTVNDALFVLSQMMPAAEVNVYADVGTTVTMTRGTKVLSGTVASNGYATLYPRVLGEWTISYTFNGVQKTKNYILTSTNTVYIYPFEVGATLEDTSWDTIALVSEAGFATNYWKVGDKKNISINGVTYAAQIIGFDHDTLTTASGGRTRAGITFQLVDCLKTYYNMNSDDDNSGSWENSNVRYYFRNTLYAQLPTALKNVLKSVNKITSNGGDSSALTTTSDQLFLLAEIEVLGSLVKAYAGEGEQYAWYTAGNSKVKKVNGSNANWWERSPTSGSTRRYCLITSSGEPSVGNSSMSYGMSFAFCV